MLTKPKGSVLQDHVDARMLSVGTQQFADRNEIVQLNPDHPGFRDPNYRERRNRIAEIAMTYESGQPVPDAPYTADEHRVWQTIWQALKPAHQKHACAEYLESLERLAFPEDRIPQLREVSRKVQSISGFRLEPVAGLVQPRVFLENLANGVFLCTQYIRHESTPLYTPEPDVAHEIIGHAVTLGSPRLAQLNRLFGEAVKRTASAGRLELLSRLYWFTIEFGVLREGDEVKAYGTGLLSSAGELEEMSEAEIRALDFNAVTKQEYDPTRFQPVLFCAPSFESLYESLSDFLSNWN